MTAEPDAKYIYQIDQVPVVPNKRYRIFASVKEKVAQKADAKAS